MAADEAVRAAQHERVSWEWQGQNGLVVLVHLELMVWVLLEKVVLEVLGELQQLKAHA